MRYLGGKTRLAKQIRDVILSRVPDCSARDYFEPFMGGGSTFEAIAPHFCRAYGSDVHPDLMMLWTDLHGGTWTPPEHLSEDEYRELQYAAPSALRAFAGFGCSFGGKWFGGYARGEGRDHPNEAYRNVMKSRGRLQGVDATFGCHGYKETPVTRGSVVYCDPPYQGTTKYSMGFGHDDFWAWAEQLSGAGVYVFVSEFDAPEGWVPVWEKTRRTNVTGIQTENGVRPMVVDKLFVFEGR